MFYPAKAIVSGTTIILKSTLVDKPVAARYGFKAFTIGDLYNSLNLPASSFRTDSWEVEKQ